MVMMTRSDGTVIQRRKVAPGEVELGVVAVLQFVATMALFFAPKELLAGNGTALLLFASKPDWYYTARIAWGVIFLCLFFMAFVAIREPRVTTRKWAWQCVIPVWMVWLGGLTYPLFVGLPTNIILITAMFALVSQWIITRFLVPVDSHWYSREVPLAVERQGEGSRSAVGSSFRS